MFKDMHLKTLAEAKAHHREKDGLLDWIKFREKNVE